MPYTEITGYDEITGAYVGEDTGDAADALLAMASGEHHGAYVGEEYGARRKAPPFAVKQGYHPRVIDVEQKPARAPRRLVIGFDSRDPIAAGTEAVIAVLPQVIFRGYKLVVPSDIAGSFVIADIIVGNRSQLVAAGSLPARAFTETALGNELHLDTASVSQQLVLRVQNTSAGALRFLASMFGTAAIP